MTPSTIYIHTLLLPRFSQLISYCLFFFIHLYPGESTTHNFKMKETAVGTHLKEKFSGVDWVRDKRVEGGCSTRRPDLLLDMSSHVVIVEVDENKHDTYDSRCENKWLVQISQDLNHCPLVMVGFNPDGYVCPDEGKVPSPWTYTKQGVSTIKKAWNARLEALLETVEYWMKNRSNKTIEVIELYY